MNPSIEKLAQLMQARQEQGEPPYVLLLGSSLSLTPAVRRAFAGTEDWEAFWEEMQRASLTERKALLKKPLDALGLERGYQAMAQLAEADYFNLLLTLNVDDAIDDVVRPLSADQSVLLIYDGSNAAHIVEVLSHPTPRIKVVKLRGDINARKLPLTPQAQFEFPPDLEDAVTQWLSRDTIAVGDLPFDDDVQRCLRSGDDALWCILPNEPASDSFIKRAKKIRSSGEIITGADAEFNAFFIALAERLPHFFQTEGLRKEDRDLPPPVDRFATPVSPQTAARKHNLPAQPTPFVGREAELAELARLLAEPGVRLVTILGAGGMGKTRLALEVAAAQMDRFAHGVYLTSLAPLQSVEAIVPTVAKALNFSFYEGGEPQQQLLDYLRQKTILLIMDNFEHLLHGVGLMTEVLKTAPEVKILTTSRARLNVQGEHLFPIAGMDFPALIPGPSPVFGRGESKDAALRQVHPEHSRRAQDVAQYSAVKLFLTSARRPQPSFEPTADDLTDVVRICRLVEGMPLGILLAAAWVQILTPAEIAAEISQSLDFVETDLRDVPERQRSMRAVFDHSWNLLTGREREVFQGLSVFRGGFTWQAAQQVTGASLRELMALVNKSLLHRTPAPSATPSTPLRAGLRTGGRYEVHELLRQYAAEKLDGSPAARKAVHDRHCAHYAAALQQWGADLKGARQQAALAEIEADSENARAAWNWTVERGQVERLEQATDGLCRFYEWRGRYQEGEAACRMAAEKLAATAFGDGLQVWAKILTWQSVFGRLLGHTELAGQLLQQSLALLERPELADQDTRLEKASVLLQMGHTVLDSNREEARRLYEQSLVLFQALGDRWGTANALGALGAVAQHLGVYDEAKQLNEQSLAIRQVLGDQRGIASSLMGLSDIAQRQGQIEEGERLVRESIAIRQEMGDQAGMANGFLILGILLPSLGQHVEAHSLLEESVAIFNHLGARSDLAYSNIVLGLVKALLGRYEQARAHGQMCLALSREIGYRRRIGDSCYLLSFVALASEGYAEVQELLQESVAVYQEIGQREQLGNTLALLGYAAHGLGNISEAQQHLYEALRTAAEIRAFLPLMLALPTIALLLADQGEKERAVELYALASRYPLVANSRWFEDVAGRHIAAVAASLPPDVVAAAQARGRARDLEATVAELLVELGE